MHGSKLTPMSQPTYSVLTVVGADRIGIVEDIARLVATRGGNVEGSKMAVLGGEFAAILLVAMTEEAMGELEASLPSLERETGLRLAFKRTSPPRQDRAPHGRTYRLESVSLDSPGVVQAIAALLKRHGANIVELETLISPAPWSGAPMFHMLATLSLDAENSLDPLKADLTDLEERMDWDITLHPVHTAKTELLPTV